MRGQAHTTSRDEIQLAEQRKGAPLEVGGEAGDGAAWGSELWGGLERWGKEGATYGFRVGE